jgi:hypothetical protein
MKLGRILLPGVLLALVHCPALAQDQKLVPVAPYLAAAPSSGYWTITLQHPSTLGSDGVPAPAIPPRSDEPLTIDTIQSGGISRVMLNFHNAPPVQIDRKGDYYIRQTSTGVRLFGTANGTLSFFAVDNGFLFAEWVRQEGAAAFQKVVQYEGVTCFYYKNPTPETQKDPRNGQEAWIDVHTLLPVAARNDGIEADFQFHAPPTSPPQLSPEETRMIQARENALQIESSIR